jgi:hypothetical protein
VIRNADTDVVYMPTQDGVLPGVPARDRTGAPHGFSRSAALVGAEQVDLTGQGVHDPFLLTTHLGILDSPQTWQLALEFLTAKTPGPK